MTNDTILVLGGTGKTGRRVARQLRAAGADVRTAARRHADVAFDWDDPTTHDPALAGVGAVYLVPPTLRLDYAATVVAFLDRVEAAGARHVTLLSARGVDQAPPEVAPRAVQLDLAARPGLTHAVLQPGWFMQNFHDVYFVPTGGVIAAPTGDGVEAFVHADDIAEVAAATLLAPADHHGAALNLSGGEALSFADVADRVAKATGRPVRHDDLSPEAWVQRMVPTGLAVPYLELLAGLLHDVVRTGGGAAISPDVESVTGHLPRTFDEYAADPEVVAAWQQAVTAPAP